MKSPSTHSESAGTGCQANAVGQYCLSYQKTLTQFGKSLLLSILLALLFFLSLKINVKKFLSDIENSDIVNGSWSRGAVSLQNPFGKTHTQDAGGGIPSDVLCHFPGLSFVSCHRFQSKGVCENHVGLDSGKNGSLSKKY